MTRLIPVSLFAFSQAQNAIAKLEGRLRASQCFQFHEPNRRSIGEIDREQHAQRDRDH
jgi:hypothetical protein